MEKLKADYLVIGSGAVSLAFVDAVMAKSDSTFLIVDRHHMPGGHWNDAYPFVRLHQPSATYGVASRPLGSNRIDESGSNKGYYELASGPEVLAYFEQLMREQFLPSGRVQYFPMCDYQGDGRFRSLLSGDEYAVDIARKTVDGTFFRTSVPSTHKRKFAVDEGIACIAPNDLPRVAGNFRRFAIVGGGKTAMDAGVWLLDNGADPDSISWIVPRDSWLTNRASTQQGPAFFHSVIGGVAAQFEAAAKAADVRELFARLEKAGVMMRIDAGVEPTMFHYATISEGEIGQLRRIKNVIRQGRVRRIEPDCISMESGARIPAREGTLHIDCTATAVDFGATPRPVFDGRRITLQSLYSPLVTLSASIIGYVEAHFDDETRKNALCEANVLADTPAEWMASFLGNLARQKVWSQEPALDAWISGNRLSPFGKPFDQATFEDPAKVAVLQSIRANAAPAAANLQKLIRDALPAQRS